MKATPPVAHYWVGIAILFLVATRVVVRLIQGAPTPAGSYGVLTYLARTTHFLFYLLLVAIPVTGLLTIYVSDSFGDIHGLGKPAFIVLIVLHATGALFHQFVLKDGTLRRMFIPAR
ncbi:cytochrome b [Phyllobacterium sp. K27]